MTKSHLRILITGFGPFPGAPHNPTMPLVARLTRLRRPAFSEVEFSGHIFPVTYKAVDRELPQLLAQHQPHALRCFRSFERHRRIPSLWPGLDDLLNEFLEARPRVGHKLNFGLSPRELCHDSAF